MPSYHQQLSDSAERPPRAALERALASLGNGDPMSAAALREVVWAYVDDAKQRGVAPERVVVAVKEMADRAGVLRAAASATSDTLVTRNPALQRAISWCIDRYYGIEAVAEPPLVLQRPVEHSVSNHGSSHGALDALATSFRAMRAYPTASDPLVVTASDRSLFACWVEDRGSRQRWVFIGSDGVEYLGPEYAGETAPVHICALVDEWWRAAKKARSNLNRRAD